MRENNEQFMSRIIRDYAVAPLDPQAPGLSSKERRSWWEFCVEMTEFFRNIIRHEELDRHLTRQLCKLQWICLYGTHLFATADPMLRAEQARYAEVCQCLDGALAEAVNDLRGLMDMSERICTRDQPNPVGFADALRSQEWVRNMSPFKFLLEVAHSRAAELRAVMLSATDVGPTVGWPTSADWQRIFEEALANGRLHVYVESFQFPAQFAPRRDLTAGITACCDMETMFDQMGLSANARRLAYARLQGISREEAPAELGMSKREVQAAWKELGRKKKLVTHLRSKKV